MSGRRKVAHFWGVGTNGAPSTVIASILIPGDSPIHNKTTGLGLGFAQHGSDLCFDFGVPFVPYRPYLPVQNISSMWNVSYAIRATFVSFASTKNRNHHGLDWIPHWPEYTESKQNLVYNATLSDTKHLHQENDTFREPQRKWWIGR